MFLKNCLFKHLLFNLEVILKVYLVGGAVRNMLLNLPVHDKDWVVVGSTPQYMLDKNYRKVGRDFPVFIHPITKEEYALARKDRKKGKGYTGFICDYSSNITLKEDLFRRDLTINAIACDNIGNIIDPFLGQLDLKNRILRHISPAFQEDPLRVLRVARFAAEFAHLGFIIAQETLYLMKSITKKKELLHLVAERIWRETEKGLLTISPHVYFQVLYQCHALNFLFPEINFLYKKNYFFMQNSNLHIVNFIFLELFRVSKITQEIDIRFASLVQFLNIFYVYYHHNKLSLFFCKKSAILTQNFCDRLKVSIKTKKLAIFVCSFYFFLQNIHIQSSSDIVSFFNKIDVWRKPKFLDNFFYLKIYQLSSVTLPQKFRCYSIGKILKKMFNVIKNISINSFNTKKKLHGLDIRNELYRLRVLKLQEWRKNLYNKNLKS